MGLQPGRSNTQLELMLACHTERQFLPGEDVPLFHQGALEACKLHCHSFCGLPITPIAPKLGYKMNST